MSLTVENIINIAKASQFLAVNQIKNNGLYGGGIDLKLPRKLYCIRKNVEWLYDIDPTNSTLTETSIYLYALCAPFNLKAQSILNIGGGSIAPITPGSSIVFNYLIDVSGSDFSTATDYDDVRIVGHNLDLFGNWIPKFLDAGTEWAYTPTGIRILFPGFNAATDVGTGQLKIFIKDPLGTSGSGAEVTRSFQYTGVTGSETSITNSLLSGATIVTVARGSDLELITSGTPTPSQALVNLNLSNLCNGTINFYIGSPIAIGEVVTITFSKSI